MDVSRCRARLFRRVLPRPRTRQLDPGNHHGSGDDRGRRAASKVGERPNGVAMTDKWLASDATSSRGWIRSADVHLIDVEDATRSLDPDDCGRVILVTHA